MFSSLCRYRRDDAKRLFSSVPIVDIGCIRSYGDWKVLSVELRHALHEIGFVYLKNTKASEEIIQKAIKEGKNFMLSPSKYEVVTTQENPFGYYLYQGNERNKEKPEAFLMANPHHSLHALKENYFATLGR